MNKLFLISFSAASEAWLFRRKFAVRVLCVVCVCARAREREKEREREEAKRLCSMINAQVVVLVLDAVGTRVGNRVGKTLGDRA